MEMAMDESVVWYVPKRCPQCHHEGMGLKYVPGEKGTRVIDCPDKPGWQQLEYGEPVAYTCSECDYEAETEEPFVKHAAEYDPYEGSDPTFDARRKRLRALGETFWVSYGEGEVASRWPAQPGRYAVREFSERYTESFWETYDDREEVENAICSGDVDQVVDLDTGKNMKFDLTATVAWPDEAPLVTPPHK